MLFFGYISIMIIYILSGFMRIINMIINTKIVKIIKINNYTIKHVYDHKHWIIMEQNKSTNQNFLKKNKSTKKKKKKIKNDNDSSSHCFYFKNAPPDFVFKLINITNSATALPNPSCFFFLIIFSDKSYCVCRFSTVRSWQRPMKKENSDWMSSHHHNSLGSHLSLNQWSEFVF